MSSQVFYKFKSQKEPSRIGFDGPGISVWDLKKEILLENKMGKGTDFDFSIYNADTEEEYTDDRTIIPRSTSVIARRLPPSAPGRGTAQHYMLTTGTEMAAAAAAGKNGPYWRNGMGGGGMKRTFSENEKPEKVESKEVVLPAAAGSEEANALSAMFAATSEQWEQTQEQMQTATYRPAPRMGKRPPGGPPGGGGGGAPMSFANGAEVPNRPPPQGYICYRCGQKGHWINMCPTNGNTQFDDRPRIKRTTGIPKSFLTTLEGEGFGQKEEEDEEGEEDTGEPQNKKAKTVMVTAEGGFVVARPDRATWFAHRAHTKNLTEKDILNTVPSDAYLSCGICSKMLREAVTTPCCSTPFCRECVEAYLEENDMLCPECESRIKSFERLVPDEDRRKRVTEYVTKTLEENTSMNAEYEKEAVIEREAREREIAKIRKEEEEKERKEREERGLPPLPSTTTPDDVPSNATLDTPPPHGPHVPPPVNAPPLNAQMAAMLAAQMMQLQMTARNYALPPNVRMQAQMQLQQLQQSPYFRQ